MRRVVRRSWIGAAIGAMALMGSGPAQAMEQIEVSITFASKLWALNGDLVRQPRVPEIQQLDAPTILVTDNLTVTPSAARVTQVNPFKANFAGGTMITVSETLGGTNDNKRILLANPVNVNAPFTGIFRIDIANQEGTAMGCQPWTANVPVDLETFIVLDFLDSGMIEVFTAQIDIPGALGSSNIASPTFTGSVTVLSIPIEGTARPQSFTTGRVTVMKQIITKRRNDDPLGTPTGFKTFTFTTTGTQSTQMLTFVSPVVIDARAGRGDGQVPIPIVGFAIATNVGTGAKYGLGPNCEVMPEPGTLLAGLASAVGLAVIGRFRLRRA